MGKRQYTILATLLLGFILLAALNTQPLSAVLRHARLIPEIEQNTEIYFENPTALPDTYTPGQPLSVSFVVRNASASSATIPYVVEAHTDTNTISPAAQKGALTLGPGEAKTTRITYTPTDMGPKINFTFRLADENHQVNIWLNRR